MSAHRRSVRGNARHWVSGIFWAAAAILAVVNIGSLVQHAVPLGISWRGSGGTLVDFRDLVVVPGRALLHGNNPYDAPQYVADHPWAQEFDPYAPSWLALAVTIGWLPLKVAAVVYLSLMTLVASWVARRLAEWVAPGGHSFLAPLLAAWMFVWYPTRNLGSSFLVVVGVVVMVNELRRPPRAARSYVSALGLSLVWIKPQFGLWVTIFLMFLGCWRLCVRALVYLALESLPAAVACMVIAHGPVRFVESLFRDLRYAASDGPTSDVTATSYRFDLLGLLGRSGIGNATTIGFMLSVLLLVGTCGILFWARRWDLRRKAFLVACIAGPACVLLPVHLTYDVVITLPAFAAIAGAVLRERTPLGVASLVASVAPLVHVSRLDGLAGVGAVASSWINATCLVLAAVLSGASAFRNEGFLRKGR